MFRFLKRGENEDGAGSVPPEPSTAVATPPPAAARDAMKGRDTDTLTKESRKLNLVHRDILLRAIDEAVRRGVTAHVPSIDPKQLDKAAFGTRNELVRLLKESSRAVRGLPKAAFLREVEEDRQKILAERARVQAEIELMSAELERRREQAQQAEEQIVRESRQSGIQQDEVMTQRIFELFGGMNATHEMAAVREQVTFLLLQALNQEREKVIDAQLAEHRREVENFERRISKLTHSLEMTEEELQRMAKAKGIDPGVASIYRSVQGLSNEEAAYELKLEMMASIFEANLALQKGAGVEE